MIAPESHVRPIRSHISAFGDTVTVKSFFGVTSSGSLKTFVSMPMFGIEIVGFIHNGPRRTRTSEGSGPPSPVVWANDAGAASNASERAAKIRRLKRVNKPIPNIGRAPPRHRGGEKDTPRRPVFGGP